MTDSCIRLILDVHKTSMPVTVKAKRGDTGRKLLIALSDGGIPYPIGDDCIAVFTGKKPDKTTLFSYCTIENNTISYVFTEQTCSVVGKVPAEVRLYGRDNKLLTSASFLLEVHDTLWHEGDLPSTDEMDALDALITETAALKEDLEQLLEDLENGDHTPGTGEKGEDGATFLPSVDAAGNLSWTNDKGLTNPAAVNLKGPQGEPGRGIVAITRTYGNGAAGTTDVYTINYTDKTTSTFTVYNGSNGTNGSGGSGSGENGATFTPYVDASGNLSWSNDKGLANPETVNIKGDPGNGIVSVARTSGNGSAGTVDTYTITFTDGSTKTFTVRHGADGRDGTTPQKGTDYFTAADKAQIVIDVIAALPVYNGEAVSV